MGILPTRPSVTGVWSGRNLLNVGCSVGATRSPVVAARTPDEARWMGTGKKAAQRGSQLNDGAVKVEHSQAY